MSPSVPAAPRFYVPFQLASGAEVELPERAARHVAVLRLARGDAITLFDGSGGQFAAEVTRVSRDSAHARIGRKDPIERESPLSVTLAQCVSAGDRMDLAVQKATELGVRRIVPLASERSIVRLSSERADRRLAHWRGIVTAACEQSGRNSVPEVLPITDLDAFLAQADAGELRLVPSPDADRRLKAFPPARAVVLLVGPEGGLSAAERERARAKGYAAVRFGPRVLRTETAPLAVIAAMQVLWGDC
ncbi:MAG TPA: 16S rRNA (uracil(1498)-N(3))-methyltransferase [Burkholderiales bacterium]